MRPILIDDVEKGELAFGIGSGFFRHGRLVLDMRAAVKEKDWKPLTVVRAGDISFKEINDRPITATTFLFQLKFGRTSAPLLPQALHTNCGSRSNSRASSSQPYPRRIRNLALSTYILGNILIRKCDGTGPFLNTRWSGPTGSEHEWLS